MMRSRVLTFLLATAAVRFFGQRPAVPGVLAATPRRERYQGEPGETRYQTSLWVDAGVLKLVRSGSPLARETKIGQRQAHRLP